MSRVYQDESLSCSKDWQEGRVKGEASLINTDKRKLARLNLDENEHHKMSSWTFSDGQRCKSFAYYLPAAATIAGMQKQVCIPGKKSW